MSPILAEPHFVIPWELRGLKVSKASANRSNVGITPINDEIRAWCRENFRQRSYRTHFVRIEHKTVGVITFRHERDAMLFKLRWL